ncbi:unnamed protein product [Arabis nemorensis]|uniref:Uncharacterized protein n=1 Tax=Arabis nemorensis TaxID=586526 RepID=A0A565BF29_9BRAS|nr:unnamed protein product [Arabis nemorensis]
MNRLFRFDSHDGVLLKQDLEKEEAEEQVVVDDATAATVVVLILFGLPVKIEFKKVERRPPGEIGCLTFFKSL